MEKTLGDKIMDGLFVVWFVVAIALICAVCGVAIVGMLDLVRV